MKRLAEFVISVVIVAAAIVVLWITDEGKAGQC
jgi:hypothetical protein